ncbi:MAG: hypothetical protein GF353_05245 [Candidatus Lokiarchaeota archaeon]|nr:hypothetical protein [Candidatus Lokiarchaeota archaeon]
MLATSFFLLLLVEGVIEKNLSYPLNDPYIWADQIMYLCQYGTLNYDNLTVYGIGFVIFCAGALLITNEFLIHYFFIKYVSIFTFYIIILTTYDIVKKFVKSDLERFSSLAILLSFNSLMFRTMFAAPSILAITLGIIFVNTLNYRVEGKRVVLLRGTLLSGMFLTHIIYFGWFILFYLLFELFNVFQKLFMDKKIAVSIKRLIFADFLKKKGALIIIIAFFTIPYFLNLIISQHNILNFILRYFTGRYTRKEHLARPNYIENSFDTMVYLLQKPSSNNLLYNVFIIGLYKPLTKLLSWGTIIIFFGLFYKFKLNSETQEQSILKFTQFTFIFAFIIFLGSSFLFVIRNSFIFSLASFINDYGIRFFGLFSPIWTILFVLGLVEVFLIFIKFFSSKGNQIREKISMIYNHGFDSKLKKAYAATLLLISGVIFISHLYYQYNVFYTTNYEDDNLTESVIFIGDYFNSENIDDVDLLVPDISKTQIFNLIYQKDVEKIDFDYDDTTYSTLLSAIENDTIDYVLIDKKEVKDCCLDLIEDKMDVLYENRNYLFFKV